MTLPDHGERRGARLFQADADRRRAGAARAARCRGGEMGRAGRRAFHRAERGRAQGLRTGASAMARSRPLPRRRPSCRRSRTRTSSTPASFRYIGKDVPRVEVPAQGDGRRHNTAWTCRCPAWSMPRCCNRPIRAARRRRWTMPRRAQGAGHHRRGEACRTASASSATTVEATQAAKNLLKVTWTRRARRAATTASARSRSSPPSRRDKSRAGVRLRQGRRRQGGDAGRRQGVSAANTAPATSITPRWSR